MSGTAQFQETDKAQMVVTLGDRRPDGKLDLTVEIYAKLPVLMTVPTRFVNVTLDTHVEDIPKIVAGFASLLAPMSAGAIGAAMGLAENLIPKN